MGFTSFDQRQPGRKTNRPMSAPPTFRIRSTRPLDIGQHYHPNRYRSSGWRGLGNLRVRTKISQEPEDLAHKLVPLPVPDCRRLCLAASRLRRGSES